MNKGLLATAGATAALALVLAGCGGDGNGDGAGEQPDAVKVGVVTSTSGLLASYGQQFTEGFRAGLDYATGGTGTVEGVTLEVTYHDDATDPATATAVATDLIGQGYTILTGTASSGVAVQMAPLAEQNRILYISGPAAADALTGINGYTFRSGRQTWQDVRAAESFLGSVEGRQVLVFAQDYAFGQSNVTRWRRCWARPAGRRSARCWCRWTPPTSPRSSGRWWTPSRTWSS